MFVLEAFGMIDIHLLQTAVGGTLARTAKAVIPLPHNKGRTLPLLELALELRHNRKTRRSAGGCACCLGSFASTKMADCAAEATALAVYRCTGPHVSTH